jgi:tripartite-type tricarboxylate transporter receptor subunit TctC
VLLADPVDNTPEQYTTVIEREIAKWLKVIKAVGIKSGQLNNIS